MFPWLLPRRLFLYLSPRAFGVSLRCQQFKKKIIFFLHLQLRQRYFIITSRLVLLLMNEQTKGKVRMSTVATVACRPEFLALELGVVTTCRSLQDVVQGVVGQLNKACENTASNAPPRQQCLPQMLRSRKDTARLFHRNASFFVLLLEALLKESVRSSALGEVARSEFCFIIEAITPYLPPDDQLVLDMFSPLVSSAQVALDYVDGSHRALGLAASLVLSGVAQPTSLMPCIRRRIQEIRKGGHEVWTADTATMVCLSVLDALASTVSAEEAALSDETGCADMGLKDNQWTCLRKKDATPRMSSSRGPSPRQSAPSYERQESGSAGGSGTFVFVGKDSGGLAIPFPEKLPTTFTVSSSVIVSCAILTCNTITLQPALSLGQWCLQALSTLPLTITACALSQLLARFPKAFRVSVSAHEKGVRFCDAVVSHCCRIVTTLFERRVLHGVHGPLERGGESKDIIDDAIHSVDVMPCFIMLCVEAIRISRGLLLGAEAQASLGRLFCHVCRLYVSHHSYSEEEQAKARSLLGSTGEQEYTPKKRHIPCDVVEQVLRATLRAVDIVLHDYEAGTPEILRQALVHAAPPHATLLNKVLECGALSRHLDLMETIIAVTDSELDARISATVINMKATSPEPTVAFSLAGWLPASADAPVLSLPQINGEGGGLLARQKKWVVRRMADYFRREWFIAKVGIQISQLPDTDEGAREVFLSCAPRAV